MSVSTVLYEVEQERKGDPPAEKASGRIWSRRSADHPDCLIARVEGDLDAAGLAEFRALLDRCSHSGCRVAVLDLRATTFLCLRAAACLPEAEIRARRAGVELRLISGRKEIERALDIVGARDRFRYYPTLDTSLMA